jgi:hypothetical protein
MLKRNWFRIWLQGILLSALFASPSIAQSYALRFDGLDDFVQVTRTELLEPAEITLEMWVFLDGEQTRNTRLIRKAGHFGEGYMLAADQDNDRRLQLRTDINGLAAAKDTRSHLNYLGTWHHLSGVYSLQNARFYIDGVLVSQTTHSLGALHHQPLTDLFIGSGRPSPDTSEYFRGLIDEVRIWNRPRTSAEITADWNKHLVGNEAGLVAYWGFDEGIVQLVHDLSGHGHDGHLGLSWLAADSGDPMWVPSTAPIIPEPGTLALLALGGVVTVRRRKGETAGKA